jgi:Ca2+-binding RTX toxin-like protein
LCENLESRRLLSASLVNGVLTVEGTTGNDTISISNKAGDFSHFTVTINGTAEDFLRSDLHSSLSSPFRPIFVYGRSGNDMIEVDNSNGVVNFGMWFEGNDGNDTIIGGDLPDTLFGRDGDDEIHGGKSSDIMVGGEGKDDIFGGGGNDAIRGGADNDRISGGKANDWLFGGAGNDRVLGNDGDDTLLGGIGDDDLYGMAGTDELRGQRGNDDFFGARAEIKDLGSTDNGANDVLA